MSAGCSVWIVLLKGPITEGPQFWNPLEDAKKGGHIIGKGALLPPPSSCQFYVPLWRQPSPRTIVSARCKIGALIKFPVFLQHNVNPVAQPHSPLVTSGVWRDLFRGDLAWDGPAPVYLKCQAIQSHLQCRARWLKAGNKGRACAALYLRQPLTSSVNKEIEQVSEDIYLFIFYLTVSYSYSHQVPEDSSVPSTAVLYALPMGVLKASSSHFRRRRPTSECASLKKFYLPPWQL